MPEKPIGIAMVICDQIIEDTATQKRSLIGLFNAIFAPSFPVTIHKLCVFVSLTQINGACPIELSCTNETTGQEILKSIGNAQSNDPNAILEVGFEFDRMTFAAPGLHVFELMYEGEIVLQRRFNVLRISTQ
jgi:hypothetical protein